MLCYDLLSALEMGADELVLLLSWDETGSLDMEERSENEDLKLASLLPWPEQPAGYQGMPARVGGWEKMSTRRKTGGEDLCDPLETGQGEKGDCSRWSATELR